MSKQQELFNQPLEIQNILCLYYKNFVKTAIEAENKARQDSEYQEAVKSLAYAEGMLIKSRYAYANLDRYISFKQTELKLDVALANKQPM